MEEKGGFPMRALGMILVMIGALALGYQGFSGEREPVRNVAIPPVVGGIAVTTGLILMTSALKRPGAGSVPGKLRSQQVGRAESTTSQHALAEW